MGTKVVLVEQLLIIVALILLQKARNSLLTSMTAHILSEIPVIFMGLLRSRGIVDLFPYKRPG